MWIKTQYHLHSNDNRNGLVSTSFSVQRITSPTNCGLGDDLKSYINYTSLFATLTACENKFYMSKIFIYNIWNSTYSETVLKKALPWADIHVYRHNLPMTHLLDFANSWKS